MDRITPATGQREIDLTRDVYGIEDGWPVFCEEFKQWVLEDKFPLGRPALEQVGVTFVPDVAPYELMKLRILNGGHAAIAYPAALMDIHFVHEAMEHPLIRAFLAKLEHEEIIPVVPPVPNTSFRTISPSSRPFLQPENRGYHTAPGAGRIEPQPKFILPSTADRLTQGSDVQGLALVSALWCRYFEGKSDGGRTIVFNDPSTERLHAAALASRSDPMAFIGLGDIFGSVGADARFQKRFNEAIDSLRSQGTAITLQRYIDGTLSS